MTDPLPERRHRPLRSIARSRVMIALSSVVLMAAAAGRAGAEAPRFTAEVDRNQIAIGEPFIYQVTLSVGNDQVSDYRPPEFKGLRVLSTPAAPNQSTQMQFGGAGMFVQVSYAWRYEVAAIQKGNITIGPARARVNGKDFRSDVVTVSVSASGVPTPSAPLPLPGGMSGGTSSPGSGNAANAAPGADRGGVPPEAGQGSFIRLVTDKPKVFVGEAISAVWYLYMNEPADKYDTQVEPSTEGFWTEDVVVPSRRGGLVLTQESVQGRVYQVGTVLKKALFPLRVGSLTITPMEAEISRSDFFGNAVRSQRLRARPTVIEVMPLPKIGQPSDFDAANVGTFTLEARVDRSQVAVGEPVTLTIEIGGRGNLRKLAPPTVPKLPGWKAYDPRVKVVVDPATGVSGTKTIEVLLLPERPGPVTLPALVLEAFDPEARRYTRVETKPIALTVTGDLAASAGGAGGGARPGSTPSVTFTENVISEEIRPLHNRSDLRRELGTTFFRSRTFAFAVALPPLGFALGVMFFRLRDRLAGDSGTRRRRSARRQVRAHLAAADARRKRGEIGPFFIEIDRVIREGLTSRLGRPVKGLRIDELRALLESHGLVKGDVDRITTLLEECDRARFAPGSADAAQATSLQPVQDTASDLIDIIERAPRAREAGV